MSASIARSNERGFCQRLVVGDLLLTVLRSQMEPCGDSKRGSYTRTSPYFARHTHSSDEGLHLRHAVLTAMADQQVQLRLRTIRSVRTSSVRNRTSMPSGSPAASRSVS